VTKQPIAEWAQRMAELVVIAGCAIMAPRPKPKEILPAIAQNKPAEPKPRNKSNLSPEVREFMQLPLNIQRQALDYARNWIDANFEKVD